MIANKKIFELHANICKALGHPIRIEIIDALQDKELSFSELLEKTDSPKSNLSQHLSSMAAKGILVQRKEGQSCFYRLSSEKVSIACQIMREVLIENLKKQNELLNHI